MTAHPAADAVAGATVFPDFGAVGGAPQLRAITGALLTFVLIAAALTLIVCGIVWALSSSSGNHHAVTKARAGVLVALGAAALAGAGMAWVNFLIGVGAQL